MIRLSRFGRCCLVFTGLGLLSLSAQDGTNAPASSTPYWIKPNIPTNAPAASLPEARPESGSALAPEAPGLSLQTPEPSGPVEHAVLPTPPPISSELADHLLVVYNKNDPDSKGLADYYAAKRNIPAQRVFGIACPTGEEITRAQYEETIRQPISDNLFAMDWMARQSTSINIGYRQVEVLAATRNDIWAMVLMRGVPLKIAPDPSDESGMELSSAFATNAAAVDSELALLPVFGLPKGGFVPNIFFDSKMTGLTHPGPDLAKNLILVTRLDGPTVADVRRMIDDTLYAEENRLVGLAVVDTRGITNQKDPYITPDNWLRASRDMLVKDGWLVKFDDKPEVLPPTDPCNQVAIYIGWYSGAAEGPWVTPPNRFVRGAIAYHLHSFSAYSLRDPKSWAGGLIAHGATATIGTVYEPYYQLTPYFSILTRRLLNGDSYAEAAYASVMGLSWMTTVVGDPLYRPFRQPLSVDLSKMSQPHTDHDDWLLLQQVQRDLLEQPGDGKTAWLQAHLDVPGAGMVACEGLGDLLMKLHEPASDSAAEEAYLKALGKVSLPIDRIRLGLKLADYYDQHHQADRAAAERNTMRRLFPVEAKRFGVVSPEDVKAPGQTPGESTLPAPPQPPQPPKPQNSAGR